MSEQETLTEALANLNDDNIQRAAVPEHEKVVEEVQEESTFIDLDEDDIKDVTPISKHKAQTPNKYLLISGESLEDLILLRALNTMTR